MLGPTLYIMPFIFSLSHGLGPLNDYIEYYETLNYNPVSLVTTGVAPSMETRQYLKADTVPISFMAFGRHIKLVLKRHRLTWPSPKQTVDSNDELINQNRHSFVVGWIDDEHDSNVKGVLTSNGLFTGSIYSPKYGTYFIESAEKFFKKPTKFHSIIYYSKYQSNALRGVDVERTKTHHSDEHVRNRRSSYERYICRLSIEADHTFREMAGGTAQARHLLFEHVKALNAMYRYTFNTTETYAPYGIDFRIGRIKIYSKESKIHKILNRGNLDAEGFLDAVTKHGNYSEYCEAIFFTFRPFESGVLGAAHTEDACTSKNTAVVTLKLDTSKVSSKTSQIVLAHEIAHSFGARHDPEKCRPGKRHGNFIMHSPGVSGFKDNNYLFSTCSIDEMTQFIDRKREFSNGHVCLETYEEFKRKKGLCRNGMIDDGEDCDCGDEYTCEDMEPGKCCNPKTCRLNEHAKCSPSEGLCCNGTTCKYKKTGEVCVKAEECLKDVVCAGNTSVCPAPIPKDDFLECNNNTGLCWKGNCSKSICEKYNMNGCLCTEQNDKCKVCCFFQGKCLPAQNIEKFKSKANYLIPGSPCYKNGYCDMRHYCRKIIEIGPIKKLYKGFGKIAHRFWWAIMLGTCAWIGGIVLLIKHGARYTPSSNPMINQTEPARKLTLRLSTRKKQEEEEDMVATEDNTQSLT